MQGWRSSLAATMFYTFVPQDVFADEGGSVDDMLTRCGKNHHFPVGNDRYLL